MIKGLFGNLATYSEPEQGRTGVGSAILHQSKKINMPVVVWGPE